MSVDIRTATGEGERALFIGNTQSGKTTLMQRLAAGLGSVVVMDSKGDSKWLTFAEAHGYVVSGDPAEIRKSERVIFRVDTRSLVDREGWRRAGSAGHVWTDALDSCWWRTDGGHAPSTLVIFDEGFDTMPSSGGGHPQAQRIFTSGATQGLPAWLGGQLPIYIDKRAMSQAEHCFSFAQPISEYRDLIRLRRGVDSAVLATLDASAYEFAHHRLGSSSWTEFGGVPSAAFSPPPELERDPPPSTNLPL